MRHIVWVLLALGCVNAIDATPAGARDYPYCIKGCDFGSGLGDCSFETYQQCQATASGLVATCAPNPYFNQRADPQPNRSSRRRY
jgi:Protein of unknown function (DUF3551)